MEIITCEKMLCMNGIKNPQYPSEKPRDTICSATAATGKPIM